MFVLKLNTIYITGLRTALVTYIECLTALPRGCMNQDNKCSKGISFHRLPRINPSLLHQISLFCHVSQLAYILINDNR